MRRWLIGLGALLVVAHGAPAQTVKTCNGLIHLDFAQTGPGTGRVRIELGAGSIVGGTALLINSVDFNLDCNANFPLTPPCTDEGAVVSYGGDGSITTTCLGITWSSGHPIGTDPNVVVFTATPVLVVPANSVTPPGKCNFEFDVALAGPPVDGSGAIEELASYDVTLCDNGLTSAGFQTIAITGTTTTTTTTITTTTSTTTSTTTTTTSSTTTTTSTSTTTSSTTTSTTTTSTTTSTTSTTTTTSTTSTSSTTTTTSTSTTTSSTTTPTTTTTTSTTTTTTAKLFTRTVGFWKNRPALTESFLPVTVRGVTITNVDVDNAHSALEAMCGPTVGEQRFQCCRQLTAAALNAAAGGAVFPDLASCNAICGNPNSPDADVSTCEGDADDFNNSGDNVTLPFQPGNANSGPCENDTPNAKDTACQIIIPAVCAVQ